MNLSWPSKPRDGAGKTKPQASVPFHAGHWSFNPMTSLVATKVSASSEWEESVIHKHTLAPASLFPSPHSCLPYDHVYTSEKIFQHQ